MTMCKRLGFTAFCLSLCVIILLVISGCSPGTEPDMESPVSAGLSSIESPAEMEMEEEALNFLGEELPSEENTQEEEPPDNSWTVGEPEDHGVDPERLEEIGRRFAGSQMLAAVIVRDGVIVGEFYQDGFDETSLFWMHSGTKSVMDALIGIAIDQGVLEGVDTKLADFFPQLAQPENAGKEDITIEHLLTHTSGLGEGDSSFWDLMQAESWVNYYLSQPLNHVPGAVFRYSTAGSHMLSAVLEQAIDVSTEDFAVEYLFNPLGIESYEWGTDPDGIVDGGNGLHLSVRDAAKFGQLYLDGGNWRGNQIISQEWVAESTAVHMQGESDKGQYGYQWWIWTFGGYDVYYALGYAGQFIFVVPEMNLVTAIASESVWSDFTGQVCIQEIIAACE